MGKLLILLSVLGITGCSSFSSKVVKQGYEKHEDCIERFLRLGVNPSDTNSICDNIHGGK